LFGLNCRKRIKVSSNKYYKEIGSCLVDFQNKQKLRQQMGAIEARAKKNFNENSMHSNDFNEVKRLLNKINKW